MVALWRLIEPLWPGYGGILSLTLVLYWLAFCLVALRLNSSASRVALMVPILGYLPPAFMLSGIIWRDILFAVLWLLAALTITDDKSATPLGLRLRQTMGFLLVATGVLLRPNAIAAAPVLILLMLMPSPIRWRRLVLSYGVLLVACAGLVHVVYYELFQAQRQNPQHSVLVFDLGGISHFTRTNVFPGSWMEKQTKLITDSCYRPEAWDAYWTQQPCLFVMQKLESEKIFGTSTLSDAWRHAILGHPFAYFAHRARFFWTFLFGDNNLTLWTRDLADPEKIAFADRPFLMAMKQVHDLSMPTPLFSAGAWLMANIALFIVALRKRIIQHAKLHLV